MNKGERLNQDQLVKIIYFIKDNTLTVFNKKINFVLVSVVVILGCCI